MFTGKTALLLDMNSTFMFGEDRFGEDEDFSIHYAKIGGRLSNHELEEIIRAAYEYLDTRYPAEEYRHCFPSVEQAVKNTTARDLPTDELQKIVDTFSFHELGVVSQEYASALKQLEQHFTLAVVIDIWSPKAPWLATFERVGIAPLFSAASFSSDHGIVKPSPRPFELVLDQLGLSNTQALVLGDSARRDLGGARAAGIDCVLVGGAEHPDAVGHFENLLEFVRMLQQSR